MINKLFSQNKKLSLSLLVIALFFFIGAISYAFQRFDRVGIGMNPSSRGEQLRVRGQAMFGQSGTASGIITLMPPDGTGWYHFDNAGGHRLRISGGGNPGKFNYMTISHPGKVTIHGDLHVSGALYAQGKEVREHLDSAKKKISAFKLSKGTTSKGSTSKGSTPKGAMPVGKADAADIDAIWAYLTQIEAKLNQIIQELNK